jgi:YbgC/YbaW family acyl-CoA thioester hydrolase
MFEFFVTVRGYELDSYGHLNNAEYIRYTEQARWEILKSSGLLEHFMNQGHFLVVIETNIKYVREARLFDQLVIKTTMKKEAPYLVFNHKIYNTQSGLKLADAKIKTLMIDKNKVATEIPKELLND